MAVTMYIVVEGEDPGYNTFVNGRAIARYEGALERMALNLSVKPLLEFFSADENSMQLLLEEGAGNAACSTACRLRSGTAPKTASPA